MNWATLRPARFLNQGTGALCLLCKGIAFIMGALGFLLFSGCTSETTFSTSTHFGIPVIEITGIIDSRGARKLSREIRAFSEKSPRAIIVEINTPGGLLSACESLADALDEASVPVYALVDKGLAGGAMIALAADHIFLKPRGLIGDIALVHLRNGDGDADMVNTISSVTEAKVAAIAFRKGHNPEIARRMVNRERDLEIHGRMIVKKNYPLRLSAEEAKALGLSEGTIATAQELAERISQSNKQQK